jgi:transposase
MSRKSALMEEGNRAYAALQWADGRTQKEIATTFGVTTATVCTAIEKFLRRWTDAPVRPEDGPSRYARGKVKAQVDERLGLVPQALLNYMESLTP